MQARVKARTRPVGAIEVASSLAARIAPRALRPSIDQLRHDARALADALSGKRAPLFTDASTPPLVPVPLEAIDPIAWALPRGRMRSRWHTLRTDVFWLLRDLRGERRPVLVPRPRRPAARARSLGQAARPLRVAEVIHENEDVISLVLTESNGTPIRFEAGQFLTFQLNVGGELLRRAYSLSSSPLDQRSTITIKRIGRGSAFMHELNPGDTLFALGPSGNFVAPTDPTPAHLVMIAGGSGITPIISIVETVLRQRPETRVSLVYGSRAVRDIIFAHRLEALEARFSDRFRVEHVLHAPEEGWSGRRGLLDRTTLDGCLDMLEPGSVYYVCGPTPMMTAAREALLARGVAPEQIREERFHSPNENPRPRATEPAFARFRIRAREYTTRVAPGQTLLEAGLAAGADLPFSCAMGGCGACKVRLLAGTVHTEEPTCLTERERAEGFVLTCSSRPTSDVVLEVIR